MVAFTTQLLILGSATINDSHPITVWPHSCPSCYIPVFVTSHGNGVSQLTILRSLPHTMHKEKCMSCMFVASYQARQPRTRPGSLVPGQAASYQARQPPTRPGSLVPGQVASYQARQPRTRPGSLLPGQAASYQARQPHTKPGSLVPGQAASYQARQPRTRPGSLRPGSLVPGQAASYQARLTPSSYM